MRNSNAEDVMSVDSSASGVTVELSARDEAERDEGFDSGVVIDSHVNSLVIDD